MKATRLTLLLLAGLALQNCAEKTNSEPAQDETRTLSFLAEHNETEVWTDSEKYPITPYVMWVSTQDDNPCNVPLYHTGYHTSWAFLRSIALEEGIQEIELGRCPNIPDRCYLQSTDWLGPGFEEVGFHEAKACDPELEGPK